MASRRKRTRRDKREPYPEPSDEGFFTSTLPR